MNFQMKLSLGTIKEKMKFKVLITFLILISSLTAGYSQPFPQKPNRLVNDYANVLSPEELNALEQKLVAFDDSTSTQIAVVLMQSTGEYDIADYAVRLAQNWGVGDAKYNNGILLLAAIGDRRVTIQTGYGVEGAVPDVIAYRIIENEIKPAFRNSNYYGGINRATDALISYTKGEYKADKKPEREGSPIGGLLALIVVIIIVSSLFGKSGKGGGGGEIMGGKGSSDLFWWTMMSQMGRGGRGGGFGGGRGFGGGGFGGGGFGGFGGGGFGGGGASGSW